MKNDQKEKSDGVTVHSEMGCQLRKRAIRVSVDHEKKSDEVRVDREKKSNGVGVPHEKEWWGDSSP